MSMTDMNKGGSIKAQRVKSFFIQAAKEIILREGVECVSVRKVADLAGYTFASLYNYFKDLDALLRETKAAMICDLMDYMQAHTIPYGTCDAADIVKLNCEYAAYYIRNPHIFRFIYSYRTGSDTEPTELPDFKVKWMQAYSGFIASGKIIEANVPVVAKTVIFALQGILSLYFSNNGMSAESVYEEIDKVIRNLLEKQDR